MLHTMGMRYMCWSPSYGTQTLKRSRDVAIVYSLCSTSAKWTLRESPVQSGDLHMLLFALAMVEIAPNSLSLEDGEDLIKS